MIRLGRRPGCKPPDGIQFAPLPRSDFITRITVFGKDGTQARVVAEVLSQSPLYNVTYFGGTFDKVAAAITKRQEGEKVA